MAVRPLVTIGIPSYNSAAHIRATLDSALAQTWPSLEVLVVDDASTDDTLDVVAGFSDPRLRVVACQDNAGAVGNWNRVLDLAEGEFVKLLHADDLIGPDCVEQQVEPLLADERLVMAASRRHIIGAGGRKLGVRGARWADGRYAGREVIRDMVSHGANLIGEPAAVLVRRSALIDVGGFNPAETYCVDMEMWFRLLERGDLWFSRSPLASFRVSSHQWSAALVDEQAASVSGLIERTARDPRLALGEADVRRGIAACRRQAHLRRWLYALLGFASPPRPDAR